MTEVRDKCSKAKYSISLWDQVNDKRSKKTKSSKQNISDLYSRNMTLLTLGLQVWGYVGETRSLNYITAICCTRKTKQTVHFIQEGGHVVYVRTTGCVNLNMGLPRRLQQRTHAFITPHNSPQQSLQEPKAADSISGHTQPRGQRL